MSKATRLLAALAAIALVTACAQSRSKPSMPPEEAVRGRTPREAVLGRPVVDGDCFLHGHELVSLPEPRALERTVRTTPDHTGWIPSRGFPTGGRLPSRGFLGSGQQLAEAVGGVLIHDDPQSIWVLTLSDGRRRADEYFPILARTGDKVWYLDASVQACA